MRTWLERLAIKSQYKFMAQPCQKKWLKRPSELPDVHTLSRRVGYPPQLTRSLLSGIAELKSQRVWSTRVCKMGALREDKYTDLKFSPCPPQCSRDDSYAALKFCYMGDTLSPLIILLCSQRNKWKRGQRPSPQLVKSFCRSLPWTAKPDNGAINVPNPLTSP